MSKIPLDLLKQVKHVYYHANCGDGIASAVIVHQALPGVSFRALDYNDKDFATLEPKPNSLFVDISPRDNADAWKAFDPIVLDHHSSNKENVESFPYGIYGDNSLYSGAMLAYEYVYMPAITPVSFVKEIPKRDGSTIMGVELAALDTYHERLRYTHRFAELTWIVDTWQQQHPDIKEALHHYSGINALGLSKIISMLQYKTIADIAPSIKLIGEVMTDRADAEAQRRLENVHISQCNVFKIAIFNQDIINGALVKLLLERGIDVIVKWSVVGNLVSLSFRTNGRISAIDLAKRFGGGGHERAAGGRLDSGEFYSQDQILKLVKEEIELRYCECGIKKSLETRCYNCGLKWNGK